MALPPDAAEEPWTFRRVPNRVARGLTLAAIAAVLLFILHVGGWGTLGRLHSSLFGPALLVGLPIAFLVAFFLAAPALRALARAGRLTRGRAVGLGALVYGAIAALWQMVFAAGPPELWVGWLLSEGWGPGAVEALAIAYRHVATPLAFAGYGAVAAGIGWLGAFGLAPRAPEGYGR